MEIEVEPNRTFRTEPNFPNRTFRTEPYFLRYSIDPNELELINKLCRTELNEVYA